MSFNFISNSPMSTLVSGEWGVYFEVPNNNLMFKMYLNEHSKIPEGYFVYDYFGSGEIFINLNSATTLLGPKDSFANLYRDYFVAEDGTLRNYPDVSVGTLLETVYGDARVVLLNSDPPFSYMFKVQDFFECSNHQEAAPAIADFLAPGQPPFPIDSGIFDKLIKFDKIIQNFSANDPFILSNSLSHEKSDAVICKYHSHISVSGENDIVSTDYKFANHVVGMHSCSNPTLSQEGTVSPCTMIANKPACVFYSPVSETVVKVNVNPSNTSHSIEFSLTKSKTENSKEIFVIKNETDSVILNTIPVANDIAHEDAIKEVTDIFNEYISCYENDTVTQQENVAVESAKEKKNFILSLIGA